MRKTARRGSCRSHAARNTIKRVRGSTHALVRSNDALNTCASLIERRAKCACRLRSGLTASKPADRLRSWSAVANRAVTYIYISMIKYRMHVLKMSDLKVWSHEHA